MSDADFRCGVCDACEDDEGEECAVLTLTRERDEARAEVRELKLGCVDHYRWLAEARASLGDERLIHGETMTTLEEARAALARVESEMRAAEDKRHEAEDQLANARAAAIEECASFLEACASACMPQNRTAYLEDAENVRALAAATPTVVCIERDVLREVLMAILRPSVKSVERAEELITTALGGGK